MMDDAAKAKVEEFGVTTTIGAIKGEELIRYFEACNCEVTAAYPIDQAQQRSWALLIKPKSKALTDGFGLLREVLVHVSLHRDFQPRTLNNRHFVQGQVVEGRLQDDVEIVISEDPNLDGIIAGVSIEHRVLVPLSSSEIVSDLRSGVPSEQFRRRLQERLYAADFFDRSGPVEGIDFIGREKLLQDISQKLSAGSHIGLFGLRKMGKTSIIKALIHRARALTPHMSWVHVDLLAILPVNRTATFLYHRIAEQIATVVPRPVLTAVGCRVIGVPRRFSDIASTATAIQAFERSFDEDLRALLAHLKAEGKRLVLVLDEIEQLFPLPGQPEGFKGYDAFLQYVRGLAQEVGGLSLLVVGVNAQISEAQFFGATRHGHAPGGRRQNPMFAFFSTRYAEPMETDDIKTMLRTLGKSSGVAFAREAIEQIEHFVGGHPYLIRKYCSLLIRGVERPVEITRDAVIAARQEFIRQENSVFAEMCQVVKEYYHEEFVVLHRVATEGGCAVDSINNAILAHLAGCQLVAIRDGRVEIGTELMKEWLGGVKKADAIRVATADQNGEGVVPGAVEVSNNQLEEAVKECELALRRMVRRLMDERWGGRADERVREAIGTVSTAKADSSMEKSLDKYYPDADVLTKEFLDFLYIGDLKNIILGNEWELFRRVFSDKKTTEHNLSVVAGCRNELQHFRALPDRERLRAFVAIGDLLAEIRKESTADKHQ